MITRVPIRSEFKADFIHPKGSEVIFIEALSDDDWLVEFAVPDETLVGGYWYDAVKVNRHELFLTLSEEKSINAIIAKQSKRSSMWSKFLEWIKELACQNTFGKAAP